MQVCMRNLVFLRNRTYRLTYRFAAINNLQISNELINDNRSTIQLLISFCFVDLKNFSSSLKE